MTFGLSSFLSVTHAHDERYEFNNRFRHKVTLGMEQEWFESVLSNENV